MKIADISLESYAIPYRTGSSWSPDIFDKRMGMIIIARAENGLIGIGETAPLMMFSLETLPETKSHTLAALDHLSWMEIPGDFQSLKEIMERLATSRIPRSGYLQPSAIFGIETAIADLASQAAGLPLARWLNPDASEKIPVNTILAGRPEEVEREISDKEKAGFTAYKIKVGGGSLDEDLENVATARKILGESVSIRIDANRAWGFDRAVEALNRLKAFHIEYVEEPLAENLLSKIPELYEACGVDIALDETVMQKDWLDSLIENRSVNTVIIKPSVVGGIAKSLALSGKIARLGVKFVFTSLFESGVGLTACLHIAAAAGTRIPPCGFDTLNYLEESLINEELLVRNGFIEVPQQPGLGVTLKRDIFKK